MNDSQLSADAKAQIASVSPRTLDPSQEKKVGKIQTLFYVRSSGGDCLHSLVNWHNRGEINGGCKPSTKLDNELDLGRR